MLWHIMKIYERHGFRDFLLALGYKGELIKDYFSRLSRQAKRSDRELKSGRVNYSNPTAEDWSVSLATRERTP